MPSTTFITGTVIPSTWLNEVNTTVFTLLGNGTNAPTTQSEIINRLMASIGITTSTQNIEIKDLTFPIVMAQAPSKFYAAGNTADGSPVNLIQGVHVNGTVSAFLINNFKATANNDHVGVSSWMLRGGTGSSYTEAGNFGVWFENISAQTNVVEIDCNNMAQTQTEGDSTGGWGILLNTGATFSPDTGIVIQRVGGPGWLRGIEIEGVRNTGLRIRAMDTTTFPGLSPAAPGTINALDVGKSSDTVARFQIIEDGGMVWGPGNGAVDTAFFRSGVNALGTNGSLATGAPAGGTAGRWKFGVAAVVSPTSPNRTIELDINGTIYYLAAKTTNN